ncbi:MAG TPA: amidohydrolase family protein [Candidatus Binatia bacterium]|nr:amidohydrolase family protein [Candidatus Binatia bacterium]
MVIDFEHHYIPAELGRRFGLDPAKKEAVKTRDATVHAQLFDLEAQIRDMDRVGIDIAVMSCILGWDTPQENCRLINDTSARIQKEYPARFVGLAHAPILDGNAGLKEVERAVEELGFKGVTISSQVNGLSLDAAEFAPFYELIKRLDVPVFVHPALAPKGYALLNDYQLPVILTREFDLGVAVTRLIAGGIVERYPDVHFVFAHFGGGLAGYKERIARSSYRFKLPKAFDEYFDLLYFDMAGFEGSPIALRCALEGIRPERLVFATDYPQNFNNSDPRQGRSVEGVRDYIDEIRNLSLGEKIKDDMLGGTAARLLKLGI